MSEFGQKLKAATSGCRLEIKRLSTTKAFTKGQKDRLAEAFLAESESVRGGRAILRRAHPLVSPVFVAISKASNLWKCYTVGYDDGVRLIRVDKIDWMNQKIDKISEELRVAGDNLKTNWQDVVDDARERLGELFVESDYATAPSNFYLSISYPAIEPDKRLQILAPEVFEAERKKIQAKFEEAAMIAEQGLAEEFGKLVDHLRERLTPGEDGKKKIIQERSVDAIVEFANRFKELSIGSNEQLDAMVEKARLIANDIDVKSVRGSTEMQSSIASKLQEIASKVEVIVAPTRKFEL